MVPVMRKLCWFNDILQQDRSEQIILYVFMGTIGKSHLLLSQWKSTVCLVLFYHSQGSLYTYMLTLNRKRSTVNLTIISKGHI